MLLDVARGFVRDQAPIEVVRSHLETETGYDAAIWQSMVEMGWAGIACPTRWAVRAWAWALPCPFFKPWVAVSWAPRKHHSCGSADWRAAGESAADWLGRVCAVVWPLSLLDQADWGAANLGVALNADGTLSGAKHYVADAGVADIFIAVANEGGAPVLAIVERDALSEGAIAQTPTILLNALRMLISRGARRGIRGESNVSALRDTLLLVRCLRRLNGWAVDSACAASRISQDA